MHLFILFMGVFRFSLCLTLPVRSVQQGQPYWGDSLRFTTEHNDKVSKGLCRSFTYCKYYLLHPTKQCPHTFLGDQQLLSRHHFLSWVREKCQHFKSLDLTLYSLHRCLFKFLEICYYFVNTLNLILKLLESLYFKDLRASLIGL